MDAAEKTAHRTVYRIRGIPVACTENDLGSLLGGALTLQDDEQLQIRSFSSDFSLPGDLSSRTAIVSFRTIPPNLRQETRVTLETGKATLLFDTVFDGFTPLSPVELDEENSIEQVSNLFRLISLT